MCGNYVSNLALFVERQLPTHLLKEQQVTSCPSLPPAYPVFPEVSTPSSVSEQEWVEAGASPNERAREESTGGKGIVRL